jgi:hypothetical protein
VEMVPITLNGFSNDYEMFTSSVSSREIVPSFENLYEIFQYEEMWKKDKNQRESHDVTLW